MKQTSLLICLLTVISCGKPTPPPDEISQFKERYLEAEKKLFEQYVFNKKITMRQIVPNKSTSTTVAITGRDSSRITRKFDDRECVFIDVPGNHHQLYFDIGELTEYRNRTTERDQDKETYPFSRCFQPDFLPQLLPLQFYERQLRSVLLGESIRRSLNDKEFQNRFFNIRRVFETEWETKPVIAVEFPPLGNPSTIYLDKSNHYAYLGYEIKDKMIGIMQYEKSDRYPYPIPKRFDECTISRGPDRNGKFVETKTISQTFELDEFTDYTPTADDFDIEKLYCVKPLPPTMVQTERPSRPKVENPNRWDYWIYGLEIGLFIIILVSIALILRVRKRSRTVSPIRPQGFYID